MSFKEFPDNLELKRILLTVLKQNVRKATKLLNSTKSDIHRTYGVKPVLKLNVFVD